MFERILIATDGSKHSEKAAEKGVEMAKLSQGTITAVYVIDIGKEYASIGDMGFNLANDIIAGIRGSLQKQGESATKQIEEMAKAAGVPAERRILEGHPAEDILKLAEESNISLIVVGSIGVTGLDRFLLGSVTEKVVRNSKVPVLVVRAT